MKIERFRKKPVEIDAVRVPIYDDYGNRTVAYVNECVAIAEWCGGTSHMMREDDEGQNHILIPTLEGDHMALPGDLIIRGVAGEFYPCKPDIFNATYEPVDA